MSDKKAVVLVSGGLDSTTTLAIALDRGYSPYALTFRYGQRHSKEIECAQQICQKYSVLDHLIIDINLRQIGGSALTDNIPVPKRNAGDIEESIPSTYVPARNTIFLSFALGWSEVLGTGDIFIGVNALDYSGYPDCRPEYIQAFQSMANLATKTAVLGMTAITIHSPLLYLSKAEIITWGTKLHVDYSQTHSCYDPLPDGSSCGLCDSCILRKKGFEEAGIKDPLVYANE